MIYFVLHSDMHIFGCMKFIILVTTQVAGIVKYYFLKDGREKIEAENLNEFRETRIDKLVVDFGFSNYLSNVLTFGKDNGMLLVLVSY